MKTYKKVWALCVVAWMMLMVVGPEKVQAQPGANVSFQTFYDELEPYGRWINDPEYGYVWAPEVDRDFQPYATQGHWVMTEYGNTWVSDYDWGWAPFHYGRWNYDNYYGWVWVPGNEWGPAWVAWRSGGGYYGWTPLGPRMAINVSINIPVARWFFVPQMYITSPRIYSYCVPRTTVVNIYHNTTYINNYYERDRRRYVYGPRVNDIERYSRNKVRVYQVNSDSRPGRSRIENNAVRIYRPEVSNQRSGAPSRVMNRNSISESRSSLANNRNANRNEGYSRNEGRTSRTSTPANNGYDRTSNERNANRESGGYGQADRTTRTNRSTYDNGVSSSRENRSTPQRSIGEASPSATERVQRNGGSVGSVGRQRATSSEGNSPRMETSTPQRNSGFEGRERTQNRTMESSPSGGAVQRESRQAPSQPQRVEQSSGRPQRAESSSPQQRQESTRESGGGRGRRN